MRGILKTPIGTRIMAAWEYFRSKKNHLILTAVIVFILYILGISLESLEAIFVIIILFIAASFSTIYKRYFRLPPIFELMTLGTVLVTMKYGFIAGFVFGAIAQVASEIINGTIDAQILIFTPARALLALWIVFGTGVLGIEGVFGIGLLCIFAYNLMVAPISFFVGDMQLKAKTIYYTIGYTIMNFFVFSLLSGPAALILGLQA